MKTQKILKKLKELNLTSTITLQENNKILADVRGSSLNDGELERIVRVFPPKKYNTIVRMGKDKMVLEITKIEDQFTHFMDFAFNPLERFPPHSFPFSFPPRPNRRGF